MNEHVMFYKATHLNSVLGVPLPHHIRSGRGCDARFSWTPENSAGYFSENIILSQITILLNTDTDAIICWKQVEVAVKMYDECGYCMSLFQIYIGYNWYCKSKLFTAIWATSLLPT